MKLMDSLPSRQGMKTLTILYLSIPRGMSRRSSGSGVKAKMKMARGP